MVNKWRLINEMKFHEDKNSYGKNVVLNISLFLNIFFGL